MTLLDNIKILTKRRGISIRKMEEDIGVGSNVAYRWDKKSPSSDVLKKVADYFDVTTDYLLDREERTFEDYLDLKDILDKNVDTSYNGVELSNEQKQRVRDVLTFIFWEERSKTKEGNAAK